MNFVNTLRNLYDSVRTLPHEVHFGSISAFPALLAPWIGSFYCKNVLCVNFDEKLKTLSMAMMVVHALLYDLASYSQFEKTHHIPFCFWQMFKPWLLVGLTCIDASHPWNNLHQAFAWGYILMSLLSSLFWWWVNRHDISGTLALRVLGMYVVAPLLYIVGCLYSYGLTETEADAFYYLTIVHKLFFCVLIMLNVFILCTKKRIKRKIQVRRKK